MIRKVPNMKAWVLKCKDYPILHYNTKYCLFTCALPLFDTDPPLKIPFLIDDDDELILAIDASIDTHSLTLEQIEEINKT